MHEKSIAQRAFELARDGSCRTLDDIRRKLTAERYDGVQAHLGGGSIQKQLRAVLMEGRGNGSAATPAA